MILGFLGATFLGALAGCTTPDPGVRKLREVGAACAFGSQCASQRCSADVPSGGCGVCLEVRRLGESCDGPQQGCSASAICQDGVCQSTKKVVGEVCMLGPKGGDLGECDDELYCAGQPGETGSCAARIPLGAACESWPARCVQGAYCGPSGVCAIPPADSCVLSPCEAGFFCEEYQTCRPATLQIGDRCGIVDGNLVNNDCQLGSVCGNLEWPNGGGGPGTIYTCVALPKAGEICIRGRCAEGLFCAEQTTDSIGVVPPRCEPLRDEGEACSNDYIFHIDCAVDLECRKGTCQRACH